MRIILSILLIAAAIGAAAFAILGFQGKLSRNPPLELFPDMDRQAKLRPQETFKFMPNGVSSQLPPAGTIARSEAIQTAGGVVYRFEDSPVNTGRVAGTTNFVEANPLAVNLKLIQHGRERFDIYCAPCHGRLGDGNGITKKIGVMAAAANLHDRRIVELTDGEIFNTVTYGKGLMGAAGPLISTEDRWAVIAYLRALQLSHLGVLEELTPEQSAALKK
ncbi:MAG: cytochrome c [Verrucomicrobiota bacterium]